MAELITLSRRDARRAAVRAQLLSADRPADMLAAVRHLTMLQLDPTAAIAPAADLVLWSRLGNAYVPQQFRSAIDARELVELEAIVRPAEDIRLYRAEMAAWFGAEGLGAWQQRLRDWVRTNDACRRDILARLEASGPLRSRDLPDTTVEPWRSSGWTNARNVTRMLDAMAATGEVAVAGRHGRERLWDLADRVYPDDPVVPLEEALRERERRRLRSLGIVRPTVSGGGVDPAAVGGAGLAAIVDGVPGEWLLCADVLDGSFEPRTALLSPFDRLVHDRMRLAEIFGFEYVLEMYKPAADRRWGYFALPILYGDELVGKFDARADRRAGVLRVHAIHRDGPWTADMAAAVDAEIGRLASWLDLEVAMT